MDTCFASIGCYCWAIDRCSSNREPLKPIWKHFVENRIAVEMILDSESLRDLPRDEFKDYHSKVHGDIDLESDSFGHKFEGLIETLTDRMRLYLITK